MRKIFIAVLFILLSLSDFAVAQTDIQLRDEGVAKGRTRILDCVGEAITCTLINGVGKATVSSSRKFYCPDSGSNDTYACTPDVPYTTYETGMRIDLRPNTVNTGAATVNVSSLGSPKTITQHDGTTLANGMLQAGLIYPMVLHASGTFRLMPGGSGSGGNISASGTPTTSKIARFASSSTIGDSSCSDDGAGTVTCGDISGGSYWDYVYATPTAVNTVNTPDKPYIQLLPYAKEWMGRDLTPDGTNCAQPTQQTLNSGPVVWTFSCADSNSSIIYGQTVLQVPITTAKFRLSLFHGTTETITFAGDFSAQCRANGTVPNTSWGTAVAADVAITTANQIAEATTTAVTPNGTCSVGATLFWRYVVDATNFSTNSANAKVLSVYMEKAS